MLPIQERKISEELQKKLSDMFSVCISIVNVHLFVHDIRAFVTNINYGMVEKSI